MRARWLALLCGASGLLWASGWAGCGGGSAGGTGAGGSTNCTGGPFAVGCEPCVEGSCCAQAAACYSDMACASCLAEAPADAGACMTGATANWDALVACVRSSCSAECLPSSTCNPVTNAGCSGGSACDLNQDGVYTCFVPATEATICGACSSADGPPCAATLHCLEPAKSCARYCCSTSDCGGGACDTTTVPGGVGLCVTTVDGGLRPLCTPPASAPSGGSCFAPDAGT